jgi:CheY-like chemotaxis protein
MKSILIAEDEFAVLMVLALTLEAEGFEVVTAGDGEQAVQRLAERAFDVVLSDAVMPRLDGLGLWRRMQASAAHRAVPFVLMAHPFDRVSAPELSVLAKPVRRDALLAALAALDL